MTKFSIFFLFSMVLLALLVAYAYLSYINTKKKYSRMLSTFKLSLRIIEIRNDVHIHNESLQNYKLLANYVSEVESLFVSYKSCVDKVNVVRVGLLDEHRQKLMKEFRNAPNDIKDLVRAYSALLGDIYEYNHPYKHFFCLQWTRFTVFSLQVLIRVIRAIICFLKVLEPITSTKSSLSSANRAKDFMSTDTTREEMYDLQVTEC